MRLLTKRGRKSLREVEEEGCALRGSLWDGANGKAYYGTTEGQTYRNGNGKHTQHLLVSHFVQQGVFEACERFISKRGCF